MSEQKEQVIYGRKTVLEALESNLPINKVYISNNLRGVIEGRLRAETKRNTIPMQYVEMRFLDKLAKKNNHQGVVALSSPIRYHELAQLIPHIFEQGQQPLLVLLDGITDVRNFGAIARSAEVLGAHGLVVSLKNAAPVNEVSIKTSAGALVRIPVCRCKSMMAAIEELKEYGVVVFGADGQAEQTIDQLDFKQPSAIVFGAEGKGIDRNLKPLLDHLFKLRQVGQLESLNVSVACGITLYGIMMNRTQLS